MAGGVIGGILGAGSQPVGNIVSGQKWYDGLGSAAIGGAVGGAVFAGTGNMAAASYAGAAAQSVSSESWQYISGKKELTLSNVSNSLLSVATETAVNGTTSLLLGKGMDKMGSFLSKTNIGSKLSNTIKNIKSKAMLKLCSGNKGFGFKLGNTEILYQTPKTQGGAFISTKNSSTGFLSRVEWDTQYGLHYHYRPRSGVTTKNHMPIRSTFIVPSVRNKK